MEDILQFWKISSDYQEFGLSCVMLLLDLV